MPTRQLVPSLALVATTVMQLTIGGAGRNATRKRCRLGTVTYDDAVAQLCGWEGGISAFGSGAVHTLMSSGGECDHVGSWGWCLVVRLKDEV